MSKDEWSFFKRMMYKIDEVFYNHATEVIPNFIKTLFGKWSNNLKVIKFHLKLEEFLLEVYNFWDLYILAKIIRD